VAAVDNSFEVDVDHPVILPEWHVLKPADCFNAGVVDPYVDPPERSPGEAVDLVGLADIRGNNQRGSACRTDFGCNLLRTSVWRAASTTLEPWLASFRAMPRPNPLEAPVTT
jgi:hypothetical protein